MLIGKEQIASSNWNSSADLSDWKIIGLSKHSHLAGIWSIHNYIIPKNLMYNVKKFAQ